MSFAIRDAVRADAEALLALRLAIFGETDFLLYGDGEYKATAAEIGDQLDKVPGLGHSRALLAETIRWAPGAGLTRLELFVAVGNHRAIALYERMGFQFEGTRRHAYVIRGEPVDDWMMAYVFDG